MPTETARLALSVRMRDEEIETLLDTLDEATSSLSRRRTRRYSYRIQGMPLYVKHPGAHAPIGYRVPTRNICTHGLSFLHGGFLHTGTRCQIQLLTSYGTWTNIDCTTIHCRLLRGGVHEVGVQFDKEIDVAQYARGAQSMRILLAEDADLVARLAEHHFAQLNAEVKHVTDGQQAVDTARTQDFDILLLDIHMPVLDGCSATKELRRQGYTGYIVIMSSDNSEKTKSWARESGCNHFLPKPFNKNDLSKLLDFVREEPLMSTLYDDPTMRPLIDAYLNQLSSEVRALESAFVAEDQATLTHLLRDIKGEGTGYGFELLTQKATALESALESGKGIPDLRNQIIELIKLCQLAYTSAAPQNRGHDTTEASSAPSEPAKNDAPKPADKASKEADADASKDLDKSKDA